MYSIDGGRLIALVVGIAVLTSGLTVATAQLVETGAAGAEAGKGGKGPGAPSFAKYYVKYNEFEAFVRKELRAIPADADRVDAKLGGKGDDTVKKPASA